MLLLLGKVFMANFFPQSLIPHSHRDRNTVMRQIDQVRVSVATDIFQTFVLDLGSTKVDGNPVRTTVSLSHTGYMLGLNMTEECAVAKCPPHELVSSLAALCEIQDPNHYSLLYTALSNPNLESILSTFHQQGVAVTGLRFGMP